MSKEKLSKEDLIDKGVLPPERNKKKKQTPVSDSKTEEKTTPLPYGLQKPDTEDLYKKHSQRGQVALGFMNILVEVHGCDYDPDALVDYSFELANAFQDRIDHDYKKEMLSSDVSGANKE